VVTLLSGAAGGLFARLLIASLTGAPGRLNRWRARFPVRFAAAGGLAIAIIGLVTGGVTFGAGSEAVKQMLQGHDELTPLYTVLKFVATWLTAWCGVPGGIFAPSLSIGAGIGDAVARLASSDLGAGAHRHGHGRLPGGSDAGAADRLHHRDGDGRRPFDGAEPDGGRHAGQPGLRMISRPLYDTLAEHMVASSTTPMACEPPRAPAGPPSA
jgi:hypothetical protein